MVFRVSKSQSVKDKSSFISYYMIVWLVPMCQTRNYKNTNTKYTNTQIQYMTKCQKDPTCGIFLKCRLFKDIKNDIPMSQTCNYKNTNTKYTNTQIQHMTKRQKDPTCGIFLKWGLFKDIKNDIAMCQTPKYKNTNLEYTNTSFAEMPERCGMFLKRGLFKDIFWVSHSCTRSTLVLCSAAQCRASN